jgi:quinoprotein glucose dehydrogenase
MTAIDMNTGDHKWLVPAGTGERFRNHPMLQGVDLPALGGDSTFSGPLLTRTLLIYALTTGGPAGGARLVAYDKITGAEVGSVDLPGAAVGTPMTYLLDGRQYIALTVQGASQGSLPELVALTLP